MWNRGDDLLSMRTRHQFNLVINGYYRKNGYMTMSVSLLRPVLFTCAVSEVNIIPFQVICKGQYVCVCVVA